MYIYIQRFPLEKPPLSLRSTFAVPARKHRTWRALAQASRAPIWAHGDARMGCSSPYSAPPECSKGLLEPPLGAPRALEGAARDFARCPQGGCSSLLSVPACSKWLFKLLVCTTGALRAAFQAPVPERLIRRSRMLHEESVLGYI